MKRLILVLLSGLLLIGFAFAQAEPRSGKATQEMLSGGMLAAVSGVPLNAEITVKNTRNGKEAKVIISSHIPDSPDRIMDLSWEAWDVLDMRDDDIVSYVYAPSGYPASTPAVASNDPWANMSIPDEDYEWEDDPQDTEVFVEVAEEIFIEEDDDGYFEEEVFEEVFIAEDFSEEEEPVMAEVPVAEPAPAIVPAAPAQTAWVNPSQILYHLLILDRRYSVNADIGDVNGILVLYKYRDGANGYLVALYTSPSTGPVFPQLPDRSRIVVDMVSARKGTLSDYVQSSAFRRYVVNPTILSQLQNALDDISGDVAINSSPNVYPMGDVKVIPGLPNPNSGKIYRIQVGAFSVPESADRTMQQIRNAGLQADQEIYGSLRRVLAVGVRAADVNAAVQALGAAGFKEVWVKE